MSAVGPLRWQRVDAASDFQRPRGDPAEWPEGPWLKTAADVSMRGNRLCARLQRADGTRAPRTCVNAQPGQTFSNNNGGFVTVKKPLPGGTWIYSAKKAYREGNLVCALLRFDNLSWNRQCIVVEDGQYMENVDGAFRVRTPACESLGSCIRGYNFKIPPNETYCIQMQCHPYNDLDVCCDAAEPCLNVTFCPPEFVRSYDYCPSTYCSEERDMDLCCVHRGRCRALGQCLRGYVLKPDAASLQCPRPICEHDKDLELCCDDAVPCANMTSFECPWGSFFNLDEFTGGTAVVEARDRGLCCQPAELCSTDNTTCTNGFVPKNDTQTLQHYCQGPRRETSLRFSLCNALDRDQCCHEAGACFTVGCPLGFHANFDTFCQGVECDLDLDFATCCNASDPCGSLGKRIGENVTVPIEATIHSECCVTSANSSAREVLADDGEGFGMIWFGPDGETSWFVLDLGGVQEVTGFAIRNTMNRQYYDRWTTDFMVEASHNLTTWSTAASGTLQADLRILSLPAAVPSMRYVRFTMLDHGGVGGGLQYFAALRDVPGPCPLGSFLNEQDFCKGITCIEVRDRYQCCQAADHCNTLGSCPYSYARKPGEVYCNGAACIMGRDRDYCCDEAEPCAGLPYDGLATSLPCPLGYVPRENLTESEPWKIFCDGKYCDLARDRDICCTVAMNCVGNYACPHGYTPKLVESYCDGVDCIPGDLSRDRDFCCDEAKHCDNVTCSYGYVNIPDTYCLGVTCVFDRDFHTCCEPGVLFTHFRWSVTTLRYKAADALMVAEFNLFHHDFAKDFGNAIAYSINGNSPDHGREDPASAIDGLPSTKWLDYDATPMIIKFDEPVAIDSYAFQTAEDLVGVTPLTMRDPIHWTLEVSQDGINYTLVHEVTYGDQEVTLDDFGLGGKYVIFDTIIYNLDYSSLTADAGVLQAFERKFFLAIKQEADVGVYDQDIDLVLSPGNASVVARTTINPKTWLSPVALRDKFEASPTIEATMLAQINTAADIQTVSLGPLAVELVRPVVAEVVSDVPQARSAWTKRYYIGIPCAAPEAARIDHALDPSCAEGPILEHGQECTMQCEPGYVSSVDFLNCSMGARLPFTFQCVPDTR